jgi:hypothetical protein
MAGPDPAFTIWLILLDIWVRGSSPRMTGSGRIAHFRNLLEHDLQADHSRSAPLNLHDGVFHGRFTPDRRAPSRHPPKACAISCGG